jgi:hypothetical protein
MAKWLSLRLTCGADAYHQLILAADKKTRGGADTVKVSKAALAALLTDHGAALGKLAEAGFETKQPG